MTVHERLPKGQMRTEKWPVLHEGNVPGADLESWDFRIFGEVETERTLTWAELMALPQVEMRSDIHCVTTWSRFDNTWQGFTFQEVMSLVTVKPTGQFVMIHAEHGFTANLPVEELLKPGVLFAHHHDGQPLSPEHGFPLRLVVPHLYFWKSAKWVRGIEFLAEDRPGFWEERGYHMLGDPWVIDEKNPDGQRFRDDPAWFGDASKEATVAWRRKMASSRKPRNG